MKKNKLLRSCVNFIEPGDDFLCTSSKKHYAIDQIFKAHFKGAFECITTQLFEHPWIKQIQPGISARNKYINDYYEGFDKVKLIAITGTNGKTSTTCLLQRALELAGLKAYVVGTIGFRRSSSSPWTNQHLTTPDYADLRAFMKIAQLEKADFLILEASSHALDQNRLGDLCFEVVAATTVSLDAHINYHKSHFNYLISKSNLFNKIKSKFKVMHYKSILSPYVNQYVYFFKNSKLDLNNFSSFLQFRNINVCKKILEILRVPCPSNLDKWVVESKISGRAEQYSWSNNRTVVIDFAHTSKGLEYLSGQLINYKNTNKKNWLIFGCGGERDRSDRAKMLNVALKYYDKIIITSDNPRFEPFNQIVDDILNGYEGSKVQVIQDRAKAILHANKESPENSLIVIAGKGHEDAQYIGSLKIPYSDIKEVQKYDQ